MDFLRKRHHAKLGPLVIAFAVQAIILIIAVSVMVFRYSGKEETAFKAKTLKPTHHQDKALSFEEMQRAVAAPVMPDLITIDGIMPESLPDLPQVMDMSSNVSDISLADMKNLFGIDDAFSDIDNFANVGDMLDFFGIQEDARRVVIVLDTSNSMFQRTRNGERYTFDFQVIKDEVTELIEGLQMGAQFNVSIYEGGAMAWKENLVDANLQNKRRATKWVQELDERPGVSIAGRHGDGPKRLEGGGTRLDTALKQVFAFQPEAIFIVTDGEINRAGERIGETEMLDIIDRLQDASPERVRLHVVHYETKAARSEELALMKAVATHNDGYFRQVKAIVR